MTDFTPSPAPLLPTADSASTIPPLTLTGELIAAANGHDDQAVNVEATDLDFATHLIQGGNPKRGTPSQSNPTG